MSKLEITIEGMTCGHCAMSISKALAGVAGVSDVQVDHVGGKAILNTTDSASKADIEHAISEAGYKATAFAELH